VTGTLLQWRNGVTGTLLEGFPAKYHRAVVRAAQQCTVKRTLDDPPELEVRVLEGGRSQATAPAASLPTLGPR